MTATKTDVVYWLRRAANEASDGVLVGSDLLIDAADEIDYLRFAIAAWVDADAEWRASRKSRGSELGIRLTDIEGALRKAVGR